MKVKTVKKIIRHNTAITDTDIMVITATMAITAIMAIKATFAILVIKVGPQYPHSLMCIFP